MISPVICGLMAAAFAVTGIGLAIPPSFTAP